MSGGSREDVTQLLLLCREGDDPSDAWNRLLENVYGELQRMAASFMRKERAGHTLQPTELVHEAFLKLVDTSRIKWQDRAHFLGVAARAMRQVLIDHARRRAAGKRGAGIERVTLDTSRLKLSPDPEIEALEVDSVLEKLAHRDERSAKVAELRIFGGLTIRETAACLGISERTVDNDWAFARMWLSRALHS